MDLFTFKSHFKMGSTVLVPTKIRSYLSYIEVQEQVQLPYMLMVEINFFTQTGYMMIDPNMIKVSFSWGANNCTYWSALW